MRLLVLVCKTVCVCVWYHKNKTKRGDVCVYVSSLVKSTTVFLTLTNFFRNVQNLLVFLDYWLCKVMYTFISMFFKNYF